ncbi:GGDEF domain-containing protein [soil metagenome]
MTIDLPTLMMAGSFVSAVSGAFLFFAWLQTRTGNGMLWWAGANITQSVCIPLIAFQGPVPNLPAVVLAMALLNLSPALIWAAARATNGRRVDLGIVGSGLAVWVVAYVVPAIQDTPRAQLSLNFTIVAVFIFAAAHEFWRARADRLSARLPLIVLLVLHGIFSTAGAIDSATDGPLGTATIQIWFGFVHFETLAFIVGTSIFTVAMARERSELLHKIAANTDSLTGVATRRAFYEQAEAALARCRVSGGPAAMILFDLDGFKSINDTFGHSRGDQVLRAFGEAAHKTLRATDLIGRLGGEEFATLLPGADTASAHAVAERIRLAFTNTCRTLGPASIVATVSAGIARADDARATVDALLQGADAALYRAKTRGRNRVEIEAATGESVPAMVRMPAARQVA